MLAVAVKFSARSRRPALVAVAMIAVGLAAACWFGRGSWAWFAWPGSVIGLGESAFGKMDLSVRSSGLAVLAGMTGWTGLVWLPVGLGASAIVMLRQADRSVGPVRTAIWLMAMGLATGALLAPCGLFAPIFTVVAGMVWGVAPQMLGVEAKRRNGLFLALPALGIIALLGLTHTVGLLAWAATELGGSDKTLHAGAGMLTTLILAWYVGKSRIWPGLATIAVAVLIGGLGELLQALLSTRSMEMEDWAFHTVGCGVAAVIYLLACGSRMAESVDADNSRRAMEKYIQ